MIVGIFFSRIIIVTSLYIGYLYYLRQFKKMKKNLKILLSAYACEPNKGSEPEVGWKWATTLSELGHEIYVITRSNNKETIEDYLIKNKIYNLNFIYFDYPKWFLKIFKRKSNPHSYLYFLLWQVGIFFVVKPYIKKIKFDFIHHVTFVSFRYPSLLCLYKIPFIFGPISGGDTIPMSLRKSFPLLEKIKEFIRDLSNYYVKISPLTNLIFSKSHKIYVNSEATKKIIPARYHHKTELMLAIGIDNLPNIDINLNDNTRLFNMCYVGNLLNLKGTSILLETFNKLKKNNNNVFLTVAGLGPVEFMLRKKAKYYNIDNSISWLGKVERYKLFELYKKSDLLIFPSLRDSGGFVVLEAMSCGLPVATLDLGGPGQIVNNDCGIKININQKTENEIILELFNSINDLIINNDALYFKSKKSLERVQEFSWKKKIFKIYN
jgi:glycosyltransferase involved in cell wall biosynthesis